MIQDPAFFLGEKAMDGGVWHCTWGTDSYLAGSVDLDRQGFPVAADEVVGKGMRDHKKLLWKYIYKKDSR